MKFFILQVLNNNDYSDSDIIKCLEWISTDRSEWIIQHVEISDFIDTIVLTLDTIKSHYFITKSRSLYISDTKEKLNNETAIIFSENYSILNQDEIQNEHWNNDQVTLYLLVIYECNNTKLDVLSTFIISNCMLHNTSYTHSFIKIILDYLEAIHSTKILKIYLTYVII